MRGRGRVDLVKEGGLMAWECDEEQDKGNDRDG